MKLTHNTTTGSNILHLDDRKINAEAIPDLLFLAESIIEKGPNGINTHTARDVLVMIASRAMEKAAIEE